MVALSSGACVNALQCLVEQLRLEAGVERIDSNSAACRMPARMLCWSVFPLEATPSGNPDPALSSGD